MIQTGTIFAIEHGPIRLYASRHTLNSRFDNPTNILLAGGELIVFITNVDDPDPYGRDVYVLTDQGFGWFNKDVRKIREL